jgi:hypothetical protein
MLMAQQVLLILAAAAVVLHLGLVIVQVVQVVQA